MKLLSALVHLVSGSDPSGGVTGAEYFNSTLVLKKVHNGTSWLYANEFVVPFTIGGVLSVGVTGRRQRITNHSGSPWLIVGADLHIDNAPVGATVTMQVNKNGSSAFTVNVTTATNDGTATPNVVVANGDYLDVDITSVGSTVAGSDATLTLSVVS